MNLLIFGASARAAAFSALRAGLQPWCADLFADADLVARCPAFALAPGTYPDGFADAAARGPAGPWLYTGGLENHPLLVERLARQRSLWGNNADVLRRVRDPFLLDALWQRYGLPRAAIQRHPRSLSAPGRWLVKPWASAGGTGIHFCTTETATAPARRQVYYQEYIEGQACAALYLGEAGRSLLLGVTQQLVGEAWLHAAPFHYCGSVGPLPLSEPLRQSLERLGNAVVEGLSLRGLFGIDCVVREGIPYAVEVNPRYTASVEVWEHGTGIASLAWQRRVFDPAAVDSILPPKQLAPPVVGKAILFARSSLTFPADGPWMATLRQPGGIWELPAFADIPAAGTPIRAGRPILTFFARAENVGACREALRQIAGELERGCLP